MNHSAIVHTSAPNFSGQIVCKADGDTIKTLMNYYVDNNKPLQQLLQVKLIVTNLLDFENYLTVLWKLVLNL